VSGSSASALTKRGPKMEVAEVLMVIADIQVDDLPRMADFARVLAALDQVTGWDSLHAYKEATDSAQEIVVESSAFAAVRNFALSLPAGTDWKGTASELLDSLTPVDAAGPGGRAARPAPADARRHTHSTARTPCACT